jgi:hypothetical protein
MGRLCVLAQVEIVMRVLRRWTPEDDEVLDPEAVRLADLTIRVRGIIDVQGKRHY